MATRSHVLKALSVILTAGALGASTALAAASPHLTDGAPEAGTAAGERVAARLEAIRVGVAALSQSGSAEIIGSDAQVAPTWWGNGGWGRWHVGWGNGGWHNGGWGNGGWHNGGWGNGGWHNGGWGNGGWHNFWHNW
jgi:rSAM-associated Gly-rich repeat protein